MPASLVETARVRPLTADWAVPSALPLEEEGKKRREDVDVDGRGAGSGGAGGANQDRMASRASWNSTALEFLAKSSLDPTM